ncbi:Cellulose synthase-like protein E1 [Morella rubra]|uniref:Cellulose synthase-like protein E1 n=1 Tax=Morella rubra TaxID=262757 RepID=A0A6A1VQ71_9ROSI|nr:Cellulose synthase-like protein E1 [Morella rubra]
MDKGGGGHGEEALPLFETKEARFRGAYKLFASTVFVGICFIWVYRVTHPSRGDGLGLVCRWRSCGSVCIGSSLNLFVSISEEKLPGVDIFVCTADPKMEPPTLVINTVLSAMSYNYPPEKLSVYLSDDGGSELTFYALVEATRFCKHWIPFCKKFSVEPRSPAAYFAQHSNVPDDIPSPQDWLAIKRLYDEMEKRIDSTVEKGMIPKEVRDQHKGFSEWNSKVTKQDHQSIVQIMIDGRDKNAVDVDGGPLPTLVYVAREKRPQWPHNFKAGAVNALIRYKRYYVYRGTNNMAHHLARWAASRIASGDYPLHPELLTKLT